MPRQPRFDAPGPPPQKLNEVIKFIDFTVEPRRYETAWLTLIEDEAGADLVEGLLEKANEGSVESFVSFMSFIAGAQTRISLMVSLPISARL